MCGALRTFSAPSTSSRSIHSFRPPPTTRGWARSPPAWWISPDSVSSRSGLIIIGVARVLITACVFLVAEKVTGSSRTAAGASLVYAANPMFLFWSASFSYENLALPLAAFVVWWIGRTRQETLRPALIAALDRHRRRVRHPSCRRLRAGRAAHRVVVGRARHPPIPPRSRQRRTDGHRGLGGVTGLVLSGRHAGPLLPVRRHLGCVAADRVAHPRAHRAPPPLRQRFRRGTQPGRRSPASPPSGSSCSPCPRRCTGLGSGGTTCRSPLPSSWRFCSH